MTYPLVLILLMSFSSSIAHGAGLPEQVASATMWWRPATWSPNPSALASRVRSLHAAIDANRSTSMQGLTHASLFDFSLHAVAPSVEGTWVPLHRPFGPCSP